MTFSKKNIIENLPQTIAEEIKGEVMWSRAKSYITDGNKTWYNAFGEPFGNAYHERNKNVHLL
jgi:hypothetical protein